MRILANQTGVAAPDADNLKGKIVDAQTIVSDGVNGDIIEAMQKAVSESGITENDLPDNETNKHQLLDALSYTLNRFKDATSRHYVNIVSGDITLPDDNNIREIYLINNGSGLENILHPNMPDDIFSIIIYFPYGNTILETGNINIGGVGELSVNGNVKFTFVDNVWYAEVLYKADVLKTKVIEIGDWDMDSNQVVDVAHGLSDYTKIRTIDVMIRADAGASNIILPLNSFNYISGNTCGGVNLVTSTDIQLRRKAGETFDDPEFDSTSYNRGWITIQYL